MGTRPEAELLLCCARTAMDTESAEQLRPLVRDDLDWSHLLQMALQHGVLPLLYSCLSTTCPDAVPQAALDDLRHCFHANAQRNLFLTGTLLKLLRLLEAQGIPAIPYKGPVLAATVYGNVALRQFGDLDILVYPRDSIRAKDLLLAQGYRWWDGRPLTLFPRLRKVYELVSADEQVLVELHWAITSPKTFFFPLDPTLLWARLETISLLDTPVCTLAPEDALLILCVHGAKHHWGRLGWICDVAALLRASPQLDWGRILEQAQRLGGIRMLALGVRLAHDLLGTVVPEEVWHRVQTEAVVSWLAAQVRAQLFAATMRPVAAVDHPAFYLRLRERLRDRVWCGLYLGYHLAVSSLLHVVAQRPPSAATREAGNTSWS